MAADRRVRDVHAEPRLDCHRDGVADHRALARREPAAAQCRDHLLSVEPRRIHPDQRLDRRPLRRRRVFSAAIVVFTLGSIGCGLANSLAVLVVARIVPGHGRRDDGAGRPPRPAADASPKSELVRAMSYVSIPALIGPVIGPPLGGFIVTYASWRWIFFINIPIGMLGVVLVNLFVGNMREATARPFDLRGFALTGIGLASLAFGFDSDRRAANCRSSRTSGLLAVGALCLSLYVRHAGRVDHPIIDLALMRIPTYAAATIGRLSVPHGDGRPAVPDAADAAGRVRPRRAVLGAADLRQRRRRDDDEGDGRPDHPDSRLPAGADRQHAVISAVFLFGIAFSGRRRRIS